MASDVLDAIAEVMDSSPREPTGDDLERLEFLQKKIGKGILAHGEYYAEIRDKRLYRHAGFSDWNTYCKTEFRRGKSIIDKIIRAWQFQQAAKFKGYEGWEDLTEREIRDTRFTSIKLWETRVNRIEAHMSKGLTLLRAMEETANDLLGKKRTIKKEEPSTEAPAYVPAEKKSEPFDDVAVGDEASAEATDVEADDIPEVEAEDTADDVEAVAEAPAIHENPLAIVSRFLRNAAEALEDLNTAQKEGKCELCDFFKENPGVAKEIAEVCGKWSAMVAT